MYSYIHIFPTSVHPGSNDTLTEMSTFGIQKYISKYHLHEKKLEILGKCMIPELV